MVLTAKHVNIDDNMTNKACHSRIGNMISGMGLLKRGLTPQQISI